MIMFLKSGIPLLFGWGFVLIRTRLFIISRVPPMTSFQAAGPQLNIVGDTGETAGQLQ